MSRNKVLCTKPFKSHTRIQMLSIIKRLLYIINNQSSWLVVFGIKFFALYIFQLKKKKGVVGERVIKQFHYTSWPDHGVPCHPLPVLTFVRKSSEANPQPIGTHGSQVG